MKKLMTIVAKVAMKSAQSTCKEVSKDGMYQAKRPESLR